MAGCQRQRWHQYHQKNEVFGEREKLLKFALACSKLGEEKKWNKIQEGKVGEIRRKGDSPWWKTTAGKGTSFWKSALKIK